MINYTIIDSYKCPSPSTIIVVIVIIIKMIHNEAKNEKNKNVQYWPKVGNYFKKGCFLEKQFF